MTKEIRSSVTPEGDGKEKSLVDRVRERNFRAIADRRLTRHRDPLSLSENLPQTAEASVTAGVVQDRLQAQQLRDRLAENRRPRERIDFNLIGDEEQVRAEMIVAIKKSINMLHLGDPEQQRMALWRRENEYRPPVFSQDRDFEEIKKNQPEFWRYQVRKSLAEVEDRYEGIERNWSKHINYQTEHGNRKNLLEELERQYPEMAQRAVGEKVEDGVRTPITLLESLINEVDAAEAAHNEYYLWRHIQRGGEVDYLKSMGSEKNIFLNGPTMDTLANLPGNRLEDRTGLGDSIDYAYRLWSLVGLDEPVDGVRLHNVFITATSATQLDSVSRNLARNLMKAKGLDEETAIRAVKLGRRLMTPFGESDFFDVLGQKTVKGRKPKKNAKNEEYEEDDTIKFRETDQLKYHLKHYRDRIPDDCVERVSDSPSRFAFSLMYRNLQNGEQGAQSTFVSRLQGFYAFRLMRVGANRGFEVNAEMYNIPGGFEFWPKHLMLSMPDMIQVKGPMVDGKPTSQTLRNALLNGKLRDLTWSDIESTRTNINGEPERVSNPFDYYHYLIGRSAALFGELTTDGENGINPQQAEKVRTLIGQALTSEVIAYNLGKPVSEMKVEPKEGIRMPKGIDKGVTYEEAYKQNLFFNFLRLAYRHTLTEAAQSRKIDSDERTVVLSTMYDFGLIGDVENEKINGDFHGLRRMIPGLNRGIEDAVLQRLQQPLQPVAMYPPL